MLQILTSKYKKSNRDINISNISDLPFDVMCFSLGKMMMVILCQMNQQSIGFLKQPANEIGANVMTLCEFPEVNNKINKIELEVEELSMNCTYLCFG